MTTWKNKFETNCFWKKKNLKHLAPIARQWYSNQQHEKHPSAHTGFVIVQVAILEEKQGTLISKAPHWKQREKNILKDNAKRDKGQLTWVSAFPVTSKINQNQKQP